MSKKTPADDYTVAEVERRATDALRRALTTPYKPQRELKIGRREKKKKQPVKKKIPKSR